MIIVLWPGCCCPSRRLAMTRDLKAAALLWFLDSVAWLLASGCCGGGCCCKGCRGSCGLIPPVIPELNVMLRRTVAVVVSWLRRSSEQQLRDEVHAFIAPRRCCAYSLSRFPLPLISTERTVTFMNNIIK